MRLAYCQAPISEFAVAYAPFSGWVDTVCYTLAMMQMRRQISNVRSISISSAGGNVGGLLALI